MIEFTISNKLLFPKLPLSGDLLPMKCSTARLMGNSSIAQKQEKQRIAGVWLSLLCFVGGVCR